MSDDQTEKGMSISPKDRAMIRFKPISPIHKLKSQLSATNEKNEKLEQESRTDPLTGVDNLKALEEWLAGEDERFLSQTPQKGERRGPVKLDGETGILVFIDVDHLKATNDKEGHETGDILIKNVVAAAKKITKRPLDKIFRRGGDADEFIIALPGDNPLDLDIVAENFFKALKEVNSKLPFKGLEASASIGVGGWHRDRSARETLDRLDRAVSREKDLRDRLGDRGSHVDTRYLY